MGVQINGKYQDKPMLNGFIYNAYLNGKKVWMNDAIRPIDTSWSEIVIQVNSPTFIIPLQHRMYNEETSFQGIRAFVPTLPRHTWEVSVDNGKTWREYTNVRSIFTSNDPYYPKGGIEITIPHTKDGYWFGIRPKGEAVYNGWFGPFGFTANEISMTNMSKRWGLEPLTIPSGAQFEASSQTNRNKMVSVHVNSAGLHSHPFLIDYAFQSRDFRTMRCYMYAWMYNCQNLEEIDFSTVGLPNPRTDHNAGWDNSILSFVYDYTFADCPNIKSIKFRAEDISNVESGNGAPRSYAGFFRNAGRLSYPSPNFIPDVTQSSIMSRVKVDLGTEMVPFGEAASLARIAP